jgi:hypothetical protein
MEILDPRMANPTKRDSAASKVAAVARSIVTYQIGLSVGCRRMTRTFSWLAPYETSLPTIFQEYLNNVRNLPIGSERLHWNRDILRQKDIEIERINQQFRDQIFEACWALIDRFADSGPTDVKPID